MLDPQGELVRVSAAGTEPVLLADIKLYLRIEPTQTTEDAMLQKWISAARKQAERFCRRSFLIGEQWKLSLDRFPWPFLENQLLIGQPFSEFYNTPGMYLLMRPQTLAIEIPMGPVSAVIAITYTDTTGAPQTLDPSAYTFVPDDDANPRIYPAYETGWPMTENYPGSVQILFTAGAAPDEDVALAIMQLIAHWYANREAVVMVSGVVPQAVKMAWEDLLWPHRLLEF